MNNLRNQIRDMVQTGVPGFALAAKGRRRRITSTASLSDAFFESVAAACGVHPDLAAAGKVTASELRDVVARSRVRASLAEELRILARGVDDTDAEDRNEVGKRALTVYYVAGRINRPEEREMLIPHLAAMKRTLNRGRNNAKRVAAAKAKVAEKAIAEKAKDQGTEKVTTRVTSDIPAPAAPATSPSTLGVASEGGRP